MEAIALEWVKLFLFPFAKRSFEKVFERFVLFGLDATTVLFLLTLCCCVRILDMLLDLFLAEYLFFAEALFTDMTEGC